MADSTIAVQCRLGTVAHCFRATDYLYGCTPGSSQAMVPSSHALVFWPERLYHTNGEYCWAKSVGRTRWTQHSFQGPYPSMQTLGTHRATVIKSASRIQVYGYAVAASTQASSPQLLDCLPRQTWWAMDHVDLPCNPTTIVNAIVQKKHCCKRRLLLSLLTGHCYHDDPRQ